MSFLQGSNSYFVLGDDHDDWEGRSQAAIQKVYPFVSEEVIPRNEVYRFEQNKGHSGPGKPYPGISGVSGPIRMLLGDTHLGTILKWITGDDSLTTTKLTGGVMIPASTEVTVGTAQAPASGKQPKDLVDAPVGIGQIKVTLTGASGAGNIEIKGVDQLNRDIKEIISFATPTNHTSTKYFREVSAITLNGVSEATQGTAITWKVEAMPDSHKHVLNLQDAIPKFKTMEMVYGGSYPIAIAGAVPSGAQFTFGNAIELTMDILGRRAHLGENLIGGTTKTDVSSWTNARPTGNVMVDLATILEIDGDEEFCSTINFGINQNLAFAETKYGKRLIYEREPVRNGDRELTAGFTLDYDQAKEIAIKSYGEDLDVKLTFAAAPQGGNHTSIQLHAPRCAFAELAVPPISGGGPIYQPVSLLPYATAPGNELAVTVHTPESAANFI